MRNYALITTALSALLFGLTISTDALAEEALAGTLPDATAGQVFMPATAAGPVPASKAPSAPASALPAPTPASTTAEAVPTVTTPPIVSSSTTSTLSSVTTTNSLPPVTTPSGSVDSAVMSASSSMPNGNTLSGSPSNNLTTSPAVPQVVQDAMNRLQKTDQINLDDMIRAQDAINRLDLLLEIEKRQSELKKIRDERSKPAASSLLGSAIPASALNLPKLSSITPPPSSASSPDQDSAPARQSSSERPRNTSGDINEKYSIRRITGTDGRYAAIINIGDGTSQMVRVGEKLPDNSQVKSISLTSVSLFKEKKSKTLTIPTDSYIVRESGNAME